MSGTLRRSIRPAKSGQVIASLWPIGVQGAPCSVTKYGLSGATVIQETKAAIVPILKVHSIAKTGPANFQVAITNTHPATLFRAPLMPMAAATKGIEFDECDAEVFFRSVRMAFSHPDRHLFK